MEFVAVLDNIRSVHNVGSIFRTADAAGVTKIYLCGITPVPLDRFGKTREAFRKVSLGAERSVSWERVSSCTTLLKKLRREKFYICALEQHARSRSLFARESFPRGRKRIALVLGSEVAGISEAVVAGADRIIEIPMRGSKESLNVSVAFGIAAYRVVEVLNTKGPPNSPQGNRKGKP